MLSADSYTLPRRRSGRRRWIKLRVHTRRLANIGANVTELRGLAGGLARFFSWLGFLGTLLWSLVQRAAKRIYRFGCGLLDSLLETLRIQDANRWQLYRSYTHVKSLFHRREHGRAAAMILMASATVMIISSCMFDLGYEVRLNG